MHHANFASVDEISRAEAMLDEVNFQPLHHEGEIARYQQSLDNNECVVLRRICYMLETVCEVMEPSGELGIETYAFKYCQGQGVPEHRDKRRHVVSLMVYVGCYEGGEFVYRIKDEKVKLEMDSGDALILLNETSSGKWRNPLHRVKKVRSGERKVLVGSLVRE